MLTTAFFHTGIMHITMNMLSFHPSGSGIEKALGSLAFFNLILVQILVSSLLLVGVSFVAAKLSYDQFEKAIAHPFYFGGRFGRLIHRRSARSASRG